MEVEVDDDKRKGRKKKVTVMEYEYDADMEGGATPPPLLSTSNVRHTCCEMPIAAYFTRTAGTI